MDSRVEELFDLCKEAIAKGETHLTVPNKFVDTEIKTAIEELKNIGHLQATVHPGLPGFDPEIWF